MIVDCQLLGFGRPPCLSLAAAKLRLADHRDYRARIGSGSEASGYS